MAKKTYYFSHDYGSRNDPKLQKVLMILGQEGKGVYWDLIEMLYEQEGYLLVSEIDSYAFALRTHSECIASLINDFGLFENDGEKFWSNSVLERLSIMKEKSERASKSAKARWNKGNGMRTHSERNASELRPGCDRNANKINKSKVKDNKVTLSGETPTSFEKQCQYFIKLFNETKGGKDTPSRYRLDDKIRRQLKARLKEGYTSEDFKTAIINCKNDPYHIETGLKYLTPEFITRPDKLQTHLNGRMPQKPDESKKLSNLLNMQYV